MRLYCSQKDLDFALNIVNKAISPNNTLPVLNNILMKAEGKKLYFSSTNLEIAINCSIDADIRTEGKITVPAKLITNYISLLTDEKVELSVTDGLTLSITSTSSNTKVKCINADEFPLIPKIEKGQELKIKNKIIQEALSETIFAASTNTSRPVLSGVYFYINGKKLVVVATDSYRLAEKTITLDKEFKEDISCIIPAKTLSELLKITNKSEEEFVNINISKNQVLFKVGDIDLISRLIEGKFPDYKKIIPRENKTRLEVSVEDLSIVLKRVNLFAKENNNSVKLAATNDGKLLVTSEETKIGEEKAEVLVKIEGENNKVSLNSQYLLDILTYTKNDKVALYINDKGAPAVAKPLQDEGYVYIIMPLKV